eukprot:740656-Amphidinium_carterae.1
MGTPIGLRCHHRTRDTGDTDLSILSTTPSSSAPIMLPSRGRVKRIALNRSANTDADEACSPNHVFHQWPLECSIQAWEKTALVERSRF